MKLLKLGTICAAFSGAAGFVLTGMALYDTERTITGSCQRKHTHAAQADKFQQVLAASRQQQARMYALRRRKFQQFHAKRQ